MWRGCDDSAEVVNLGVLSASVWQCHLRIVLAQNVRNGFTSEYWYELTWEEIKSIYVLDKKIETVIQKKKKRKGKKGFCMSRSKAESRTNQMQSISRFPAITSDALSACDKPEIRKWAWVIKDYCQIGARLSGRGEKRNESSWSRLNPERGVTVLLTDFRPILFYAFSRFWQ